MSYWFPAAKYSMGKAKYLTQVVFFIIITAGEVSVAVIPYASLILNTPWTKCCSKENINMIVQVGKTARGKEFGLTFYVF